MMLIIKSRHQYTRKVVQVYTVDSVPATEIHKLATIFHSAAVTVLVSLFPLQLQISTDGGGSASKVF